MDLEYVNDNVNNNEDDEICPLCMELLDETDRNLFPCNCGYQVCLWCLHYIRNTMGNKCPACRQDYNESNFKYINTNTTATTRSDKNNRKKKPDLNINNGANSNNSTTATTNGSSVNNSSSDKSSSQSPTTNTGVVDSNNVSIEVLKDIRVIQRNLVYVVGIPLKLAKKEILKRYEYFGQYGKIQHIVVNKSNTYSNVNIPSYTAYITYSKKSEANYAIQCINTKQIDNKYLRASYGTTKYCSYFLKGLKCFNQDCYYLHKFTNSSEHYYKHSNTNNATLNSKEIDKDNTASAVKDTSAKDTTVTNNVEQPETGPVVDNIFNVNIKYILNKYNSNNKLINIVNVNNNKSLSSVNNNVTNLYQWCFNNTNTPNTMHVNSGSNQPNYSDHNSNTKDGTVDIFNNNELYINDIMNKIRRYTMLIDNLSKSYNNTNTTLNPKDKSNTLSPKDNSQHDKGQESSVGNEGGTIENYIQNILYNSKGPEVANNVMTEDVNKLYKSHLKRNECLLNHLKLIFNNE
ncbi:uncharacterized protein TA21145 [Theileria annulata]|uniref:Uncharacterized protein n=1 Tax=Theileria annulata TaxID=5874 RepID=Q4UGS7_THEAN|nr:uncharacterized protein TA21145 [Theileria annulata]CAI73712.1 unnamed protein product [Theileria annulata]|eukprot:XP_954389.1 uncharacterized protein TA21145 [Theileria annulata]